MKYKFLEFPRSALFRVALCKCADPGDPLLLTPVSKCLILKWMAIRKLSIFRVETNQNYGKEYLQIMPLVQ